MTILFRHAKILYVRLRVAYAHKVHARASLFQNTRYFHFKALLQISGKAFRSGY